MRALMGLALAGYGVLVLIGVIAHESAFTGAVSLGLGAALLVFGLPEGRRGTTKHKTASSAVRRRLVLATGAMALTGVVAYNLVMGSTMSLPEWAIIVYGLLLILGAPRLEHRIGRTSVGDLVAWSFPVVLAPLTIYSLNAIFTSPDSPTAADPAVHALVTVPTAFFLELLGTPVDLLQNNMILETQRGTLVLGVGFVCAGLYPMVLFAGMVALHGWQRAVPPGRLAAYLGIGLVALWFLNVVRLVILTKVGVAYGGTTLQDLHAHLGWILFGLFSAVYWLVVLRFVEPPPDSKTAAVPAD